MMGEIIRVTDEDGNGINFDDMMVESINGKYLHLIIKNTFSEDELKLLIDAVVKQIDYGGVPAEMRGYCDLYDKILKLLRKE